MPKVDYGEQVEDKTEARRGKDKRQRQQTRVPGSIVIDKRHKKRLGGQNLTGN